MLRRSSPLCNCDAAPNSICCFQNLDRYFTHVSDLKAEDAAFLKEYIEKEEWRIDKWGADDELDDEIEFDQDEAYLEQGAKFEADYNFRFEVRLF